MLFNAGGNGAAVTDVTSEPAVMAAPVHRMVNREVIMPEQNSSGDAFDQWAIVDVMGHQRYVGRVSEQVIAGTGFVRVDVPKTDKTEPWTKLIGTSSIYAITPVSEEIAKAMANHRQTEPVTPYELTPKLCHNGSLFQDDEDYDD